MSHLWSLLLLPVLCAFHPSYFPLFSPAAYPSAKLRRALVWALFWSVLFWIAHVALFYLFNAGGAYLVMFSSSLEASLGKLPRALCVSGLVASLAFLLHTSGVIIVHDCLSVQDAHSLWYVRMSSMCVILLLLLHYGGLSFLHICCANTPYGSPRKEIFLFLFYLGSSIHFGYLPTLVPLLWLTLWGMYPPGRIVYMAMLIGWGVAMVSLGIGGLYALHA